MILGNYDYANSCFFEIDQAVRELRGDNRVCFNAHGHRFDLPDDAIIYNLDYPGIHFSEEWYKHISTNYEVWEFSKDTADKYGTKYVPVGYHHSMERFARANSTDIDVCFFGAPNERRGKILKELSSLGWTVYASINSTREERDEVLSRSKISLNMLFYEGKNYPILRAAHCWANKVPLYGEVALEMPYWCWYSTHTTIDHLVDLIDTTLMHYEKIYIKEEAEINYRMFKETPLVLPSGIN